MQEGYRGSDGTEIKQLSRLSGDPQGQYELHGQATDSELDPSRGALYEVRG